MKKMLKQLKSDKLELKRIKQQMIGFNFDNETIAFIDEQIEDVKLTINALKKINLIYLTEEHQGYIKEMLILNSDIIKTLNKNINIKSEIMKIIGEL